MTSEIDDPLNLPIFGGDRPTEGRVRSSFEFGEGEPTDGLPAHPLASSLKDAPAASTLPAAPMLRVVHEDADPVPSVTARRPSRLVEPDRIRTDGVDWVAVATFRQEVARRLAEMQGETAMEADQAESEGWAIIRQVLDEHDATQTANRAEVMPFSEREAITQAVFDSVFRLGRLQPLVDDETIENIMATGCDRVFVERSDGTIEQMPPIADSDEELARFLEYLAGRAENPRTFTPSQPSLHMTLPGGARLAAARDTSRVSLTIRRHRVRQVTLANLVEWGSLTPVLADFLAAAVRAKLSIVVSGGQGVGKTTLLRGLCAEIDAAEVLGTFETEYELFLHEMPEQHHVVHAWEVRGGSGEEGLGGRAAGSRTTAEQIIDSFRFRLDRQILGEIRGPEVWSMVKLMESGSGSLSTTHAVSAGKAIDKLISCAMEAGPQISPEVAARKLSQTVDLVVQLGSEVVRDSSDPSRIRKKRFVTEVMAIEPGERSTGYASTTVFRRVPGECAVANTRPDGLMDALIGAGFDRGAFEAEMAANARSGMIS